MKHNITLLLSVLLLAACSKKDEDPTPTSTTGSGGVRLTSALYLFSSGDSLHRTFEYNKGGYLVKISQRQSSYDMSQSKWLVVNTTHLLTRDANNKIQTSKVTADATNLSQDGQFVYNNNGQLVRIDYTEPTGNLVIKYTYNNNGLVSKVETANSVGTSEFTLNYDGNGNVTAARYYSPEAKVNGEWIEYNYDQISHDNKHNPSKAIVGGDKIYMLMFDQPERYSENNMTSFSQKIQSKGNAPFTDAKTWKYTYGANNYPDTKEEYQNGTLYFTIHYTYQTL